MKSGFGIGIAIGIERNKEKADTDTESDTDTERKRMSFGHEKLDVYRAAIEYVGWAYRFCEQLKGHTNAKDQLIRASQAIPLNIAEGNGKATEADRRRYFEIARGSAMECGAAQDILEACGALTADENAKSKILLDRIVAMLTKLGQRGYCVGEEPAKYIGSEEE